MKDSVSGIDYRFQDPHLLDQALTHRSVGSSNYERLEFLGDSVLNMIVSNRLFELKPDSSEGDLSRMRARLVRGQTLSEIASNIGLGRQMSFGEGEMKAGSYRRESILADVFESVIGAVFLDGGFDACRQVVLQYFDPLISDLPDIEELKDAKTRLQEWLQARGRPLPEYSLVREEGADHAKEFFVLCRLKDDGSESHDSGSSRRKAEQAAAGKMLNLLAGEDAVSYG